MFLFVCMQYLMSFLVLQSCHWGWESWMLYFNCVHVVLWLLIVLCLFLFVIIAFPSHTQGGTYVYAKTHVHTTRRGQYSFLSYLLWFLGEKKLIVITLCPLRNFSCFLSSADFFSKSTFSEKSFRNTIWASNRLDPELSWRFVGPDLGPICLQRLSADDTQ